MSLDIKTSDDMEPRRQTYDQVARRLGADKPASRYDEAVLDVQATQNFHYRPLWAPEFEIHDASRTKVVMADWYALRDPRQFYYGTYNISRAGMNQATDRNFGFVEERGLLDAMDDAWRDKVKDSVLPLRHYEWGANMNNTLIADYGFGTAVTSAAAFCAADRLGMAQILSRIGLALDGSTGASLDTAKTAWLEAEHLQPLRKLVEDSLVVDDWFETFVAQNLAMDGIVHPLVYGAFDKAGQAKGAMGISMLCEFMTDWYADAGRWVDSVIKTAAAESADNAALIGGWAADWSARAAEAAGPLAAHVLGNEGAAAVVQVAEALKARAGTLGLAA